MRLNETLRYKQICFCGQFVYDAFAARRQRSDVDILLGFVAVVNINFFPADDLFAEFCDEFFFGGAAVAARSDQNGHVCGRIAAPDFFQHKRYNDLRGNGTRVVACENDDFVFAAREFHKTR